MPDKRIPVVLFFVVFGACAFFFGGSGFNQNSSFDQARAIVDRHTLAIDAYAANTYDISIGAGRHIYPNKAPGTSLLAAIPYAITAPLERAAGWDPDHFPLLVVNLWLATIVVCATSAAAIATMLFAYGRRRGMSIRRSIVIALTIALATPLWPYSTMLFLHLPSAAFMLAGWLLLFLSDEPRPVAAGAMFGLAGLTNYLCIPVAILCAIPLARRGASNPVRNLALYVAGGAPFAIALAAYHHFVFGAMAQTPLATENPAFRQSGLVLGILKMPSLAALWGITFSPYRGLFFLSPVLLLAIAGLVRMRRMDVVAAIAMFFAFNICFNGWHGGYVIGPRYLLPIVPLFGLALFHVPRRLDMLFAPLAVVSFAICLVATAVDPQPPDSVRNPIFDYALPLLIHGEVPRDHPIPGWLRQYYTGHVAVNRVAADEPLPFMLHPPGSPASEWASFNFGETLFPQGSAWSLLPLLAWIAAGAWALLGSGRPR